MRATALVYPISPEPSPAGESAEMWRLRGCLGPRHPSFSHISVLSAHTRSCGAVKTLRDRTHDHVVHLRPHGHDLHVVDADDVVAEERQLRVVRDVAATLRSDVVAAVDLQDEAVADEEVDGMTREPDLLADRETQEAEPHRDERLEAGVGVERALIEQCARGRRQRQAPKRFARNGPLPQRRLPYGEGALGHWQLATAASTFSTGSVSASGCLGTIGRAQCTRVPCLTSPTWR